MKTDQSAFLSHILDAIKKIEKYIKGIDEEAFKKNDLVQDGVIRQMGTGAVFPKKSSVLY